MSSVTSKYTFWSELVEIFGVDEEVLDIFNRVGHIINHGDIYFFLFVDKKTGYVRAYTAKTKEELLDEVLDKHYQVCRNHVEIIEYPTIKIY